MQLSFVSQESSPLDEDSPRISARSEIGDKNGDTCGSCLTKTSFLSNLSLSSSTCGGVACGIDVCLWFCTSPGSTVRSPAVSGNSPRKQAGADAAWTVLASVAIRQLLSTGACSSKSTSIF